MTNRCRTCGEPIIWRETNNGKYIPMNLNGVCHFETCPHANQWRGQHNMNQDDHVGHMETLDSKQTRLTDGL